MKRLYIMVFLLFAVLFTRANICDTVPSGAPQLFGGKVYEFKNYLIVDSILFLRGGDTLRPYYPALQFKNSDSSWYGFDNRSWRRFLNAHDTINYVATKFDLINGAITANNGLTKTANNVQFGGTLLQNTSINTGGFGSTWTGSNSSVPVISLLNSGTANTLFINNTTSATGININTNSSNGVLSSSVSSYGLAASSSSNLAVYGSTTTGAAAAAFETNPTTTNTSATILQLKRYTSGTAANNIAGRIEFITEPATGAADVTSGYIESGWEDATFATRKSFLSLYTTLNGSTTRNAKISSTGQWTWDGYPALTQQTDTSGIKPLGYNITTGLVQPMASWTGGQNIQQVLTVGDTALRKIYFKDTGNIATDHSVMFMFVQPSNYRTVYSGRRASLFSGNGLAEFNGVNIDGRPNVVGTIWGYNHNEGGGRLDTSEAAFGFRTETHYDLGFTSDPSFEFHLPEVTTFSGYIFRPFSMYIRKNSGFTNTNLQINQLNLLRQTNNNITWFSAVDNNFNTEVTFTSDDDSKTHKIDFVLPSSIGTVVYNSTGIGIASSVPTGKTLSTNLKFTYGSPTNLSGMDGYGNTIVREGESVIMNTGSNTNFADWGFNSVQKYNFTSAFANFEAPILMNGQDIVTISGAKIRATSGDALRFQSNESGGTGGDIDFINGSDGARTMTLFGAVSAAPTNVNIGPATTNPGHKLEVEGSVVVDSNLYVKMHDIASNSDSAVTWDRVTNKYKISRINGFISSINGQTGPAYTISTGTGLTSSLGVNSIAISVDINSTDLTHVIDKQFIDANNSGTAETDLYSKSIAANTLINNGASIHFDVAGQLNDATATADIQFYFGGNSFGNTGVLSLSATGAWSARGYVIRATSTTARAFVTFTTQATATVSYTFETDLTGLDFTTGNILKVTGQAGGATGGSNDITAKTWKLIFQP